MKTIRVKLDVDIEVSDDFDIQMLAVGKYYEDSIADAEMILLKDDDFRVVDYHEIIEVSR